MTLNPNDFISSTDPTPVTDQILAYAMQAGKIWNDQTEFERMGSTIAAIIAWLEEENKKKKRPLWALFLSRMSFRS